MKLKTITLIAAIMFAITSVYSIVELVILLSSLGSDFDMGIKAIHIANQVIYILKDIAVCLFFFILYKNQK